MSSAPNDASAAPTPPSHIPSAAQLDAIASATPPSTLPPPVADILQPVLNSCSAQWHTDFLFTPDPIHVAHLDANFCNRALLCTVTITRAASPVLQPAPVPFASQNDHIQAYFLLVPVFTVDHITVGVGIVSGTASENIGWLSETRHTASNSFRVNMRFLLDARTTGLIMIHDSPADDILMVDTGRFDTNTSYRAHKAFFHRSSFLPVVRRGSSPPRAADLVPCLLAFEDEFFPRNCPVCGAPPPTVCTCSLLLPRATHPCDMTHVMNAFMRHVGSFEGAVVKSVDPINNPLMQVMLGIRTVVRAVTDVNIMLQMRDWSLSDHAQRNAHTSSPRISSRMNQSASDLFYQFAIGHPSSAAAAFDAQNRYEIMYGRDAQFPMGNMATGAAPGTGTQLPAQGNNNVFILQHGESNEINFGSNVLDANDTAGHERNNVVIVQSGRSNEVSMGMNTTQGNTPAAATNHIGNVQFAHQASATVDAATRSYAAEAGPLGGNNAGAQNDSAVFAHAGGAGAGTAAAGGHGSVSGVLSGGGADANYGYDLGSGAADDEARKQDILRLRLADMVRRQKDDVRKQRNRDAAKRSNMKKKQQREDLESSLRSLNERVAKLRARELDLRHENRHLRKLKKRLQP